MNRKNLEQLATYLEREPLTAGFDMLSFAAHESEVHATTCGSIGCAIGHGPYAGIPKRPDEFWFEYCHRVFRVDAHTMAWYWCFSQEWRWLDNTPGGAAKRIRTLLRLGRPPAEGWERELSMARFDATQQRLMESFAVAMRRQMDVRIWPLAVAV